MKQPQLYDIFYAMKEKEYKIFDTGVYNLNIVGIRSNSKFPNKFDDWITVFYKLNRETWIFNVFRCTTDPGTFWLNNPPPGRPGTAILKKGQYRECWKIGFHRGRYKALVQSKPVTVIRDYNRDNYIDYNSGIEETGIFGINIHRASAYRKSIQVDKWSAGCQVFADPVQFKMFMDLCKRSADIFGNSFTYTLLDEIDMFEYTNG